MKKLLLLTFLLSSYNLFSHPIVCVTTPCEHEHEVNHDNDYERILVGTTLIVGAYFLFRNKEGAQTEFSVTSGINLYRKRKLEISTLTVEVDNLTNPENLELSDIKLNLLSFQYQF